MQLIRLRTTGFMSEDMDLEFAPVTIIWGPNGSQKTGIIYALKLLVHGYCPELGKTPESVMRLSRDQDHLVVEGWFEDKGRTYEVRREFTRNRNSGTKGYGSIKKAIHQTFDKHAKSATEKDAMLRRALGGIEEIWRPELLLELSKDELRQRLLALIGPGDQTLKDILPSDLPDYLLPASMGETIDDWLLGAKAKMKTRITNGKVEVHTLELAAAEWRNAHDPGNAPDERDAGDARANLRAFDKYSNAKATARVAREALDQVGPCPVYQDTDDLVVIMNDFDVELTARRQAQQTYAHARGKAENWATAHPGRSPHETTAPRHTELDIERLRTEAQETSMEHGKQEALLLTMQAQEPHECEKCQHVTAAPSAAAIGDQHQLASERRSVAADAAALVVDAENQRGKVLAKNEHVRARENQCVLHEAEQKQLDASKSGTFQGLSAHRASELIQGDLQQAQVNLEQARGKNRLHKDWIGASETIEELELEAEALANRVPDDASADGLLEAFNDTQALRQSYDMAAEAWKNRRDSIQELADEKETQKDDLVWLERVRNLEDELIGVVARRLELAISGAMVGDKTVTVQMTAPKGTPTLRFLVGEVDWTALSHGEHLQFQKGLVAALCAGAGGAYQPLLIDAFEAIDKNSREAFLLSVASDVADGLFDQAIVVGCPDEDPGIFALGAAVKVSTINLWKEHPNGQTDEAPQPPRADAGPEDEALADPGDAPRPALHDPA